MYNECIILLCNECVQCYLADRQEITKFCNEKRNYNTICEQYVNISGSPVEHETKYDQ